MKLYEFEGHRILSKVGIGSPFFVTCENLQDVRQARKRLKFPIVAKVQVLSGKRGKSGGVKSISTEKQLLDFCKNMFGQDFPLDGRASGAGSGEVVRFINLAQKVELLKEYYASITYDTVLRVPFLLFCEEGGADIEEVRARSPQKIIRVNIDPGVGLGKKDLKKMLEEALPTSLHKRERAGKSAGKNSRAQSDNIDLLVDFLMRLWDAFSRWDCRLIEVNPIAKVGDSYLALDAKVILDDSGLARHRDLDVLSKGAVGAMPTVGEIEAKKIDEEDYRGSAGSTFIEFDGDIAILASGGGASLMIMDAVEAAGGRPANYTEYSGNPPAEKVEKLTEITLAREGLSGCLVAGAVANFTDIYETLSGFCRGLKKIRPKPAYPIVIRRGGPKQKEAYEMLGNLAKKEGFDIHLFGPETPISVACRKMVELSDQFKGQRSEDKIIK